MCDDLTSNIADELFWDPAECTRTKLLHATLAKTQFSCRIKWTQAKPSKKD